MPTGPSARYGLTGPTGGDAPDNPLAFATLIGQIEANLSTLIAARTIGDVGQLNQTRAGRVLTAADFTDLGLAAPVGLWNLSDLTDVSGNGRALTNKGAVPFGPGITGAATEAAIFSGSTGQALWRADEAATSIAVGSWGCWFRTAKRGTSQYLIAKRASGGGQFSFLLAVGSSATITADVSFDGTNGMSISAIGSSDVIDDRWHFAVATFDGTLLRLYLDGVSEATSLGTGLIFNGTAPFNIGAFGADGGTAAGTPFYGRIDEAFLTNEVLSEDQVRLLMCAKVAHGAPRTPRRANVNVRRRRKGVALVAADFTTLGIAQPKRIYNLVDQNDLGSDNVAVAQFGTLRDASGPDGKWDSAVDFDGATGYAAATDTGLPAGTATRTMMTWFKTTKSSASQVIMGYGTTASVDEALYVHTGGGLGTIPIDSGRFVADGQWHHVAMVCDNGAADGVKTKTYLDGRLVISDNNLRSIVLAGANGFRIGVRQSGINFFQGQIARVVVAAYAMMPDQIAAIYAKGTQDLGLSPYDPGDYIERFDATNLLALAERGTLNDQDQVELEVAT